MDLIAFTGPRASGKTTTTRIIADLLHDLKDVYRLSFADFIRDWLEMNFGSEFVEKTLLRNIKDTPLDNYLQVGSDGFSIYTSRTPRDITIKGGDFLRYINPEIICEAIEYKIEKIPLKDNALVLIDDMRFENERAWFKDLSYPNTLVMMDRLDLPASKDMINDFLSYEDCEYYYQTYSYEDPYHAQENRDNVISMIRTILGIDIKYGS